jgi:hypothetical protein
MSEKYLIEWSISGTMEIEAENADEAQGAFDALSATDLVRYGYDEVEILSGPETKAQRDAHWENWKARNFPKTTEAANG